VCPFDLLPRYRVAALGHYILMASHRFVAVRYPTNLKVWFSVKNTVLMLLFSWLCGAVACALSFVGICCDQIFAIHESLYYDIQLSKDQDMNYLKEATNIINVIVAILVIGVYFFTYSGINKTAPSTQRSHMVNFLLGR
jgi:hypothetical protein